MRAILLSGLLAATLLAGCSGGDGANDDAPRILDPAVRAGLTEPLYGVAGHFEHTFVGATGTQLYVDYYLPAVPEGTLAPVILTFTPYQEPDLPEAPAGEAALPLGDPPYHASLVEYFVPRGYAVAFADVRGNHNAGGCVDQTGPEQWVDGYDYVEWLGTQPWSNGRVGMHGASYDGETQFTTAMMAPPHLATIVPTASVSNQYEWNFYQGVPYETQPTLGMASYFQGSAVPSTDPQNAPLYAGKLACQAEMMQAGVDLSGDYNDFWRERDYRPMARNITASVLHVHGLADWNVRPIHIDPLFNDIQSTKRGLFGQWGHQYPLRDDWPTLLHAWYDHFLFGRENGILDILPPVLVQDSDDAWWGLDAFPPAPREVLELELSADGTLVAVGNTEPGDLTLADYPEESPVGGAGAESPLPDGVALQDPDRREFTFTAPRELRVVGRPSVSFTATTDAASTHWVAHLNVDGATCRNTETLCQNGGYQDTRHRNGLDHPADLTPGEPYALTVAMHPQYDVIPEGAKVRLVLTNNDDEVSQDPTFARSILHLGGGKAVLRLPLAGPGVPLPEDGLPDVYPGYLGA